jgi:hypothetical protein
MGANTLTPFAAKRLVSSCFSFSPSAVDLCTLPAVGGNFNRDKDAAGSAMADPAARIWCLLL